LICVTGVGTIGSLNRGMHQSTGLLS